MPLANVAIPSPMPALFRRREVWRPTLAGWVLLLGIAALLGVALGRGLDGFLALHEPARGPDGRGAATLIVEGWLEQAELDQAIATIRRGRYARVLTTGASVESWDGEPRWGSYAERAAGYLRTHGLGDVAVIAVPAPKSAQERTYLSALMVRDWAQRSGVVLDSVDLYSTGVHARRSRTLYRLALGPAVEVGALAATPHEYDAARWWASSAGAKTVLGEALGLAWTACCFWPAAPDPDPGRR